jgi:Phosphotransferase enzyme family
MTDVLSPPWAPAGDLPAVSVAELVRTADGLRSVVLGVSKDPNAKVTVLLVSEQSGVPVMAVKVPTTPVAAAAVEAEAAALIDLHTRYPDVALEVIPRVVRRVELNGLRGVVMTAVPGTPMTREYVRGRRCGRRRVRRHLEAVAVWLASFQSATAVGPAGIDMDAGVASRLRARFDGDERLPEDLARLAAIHARLRTESVPRTVVHGDLWWGNVLVGRGRVTGVVDWEGACPCGEPVRDLARFAIMYALYLGTGGKGSPVWGAGVEFAMNGSGWFPELFQDFLGVGLRRLGASPDLWRDAVLAGLAEVAARTDDPAFGRSHLELFRRLARNAAT